MLNRRRFVVSSATLLGGTVLWPLAAGAKAPPTHTSTMGKQVTKAPSQLKPGEFVWHPEIAPQGPIVMVVSLDEQLGYVYRNGVLIGATTVSTGKKGHETPTGVFTILQKHADHYSSIYDSAPMPYMQRLTWSGVALHAGRLPGYPASHGCVRMPYEFASLLYAESSMGVTVVVSDEKKFPSTVAHPGLFTPVDLKGATAGEATAAAASYVWEPEKAAEGPLTILVTGEDRRVRVFRNGVQIGWATYSLDDPSRRLPFVVLTRLQEPAYDPAASFASRSALPLWSVVSGAPETTVSADRLLNGVRAPAEFLDQLAKVVVPGATLVFTQLPASGQTTGVDMTVVTADPAAGQR